MEKLIEDLLGLVAIPSVALEDVSETAPYGAGPAKALAYVEQLCQRLDLPFTHCDGKVAWAEIGQGEEMVGVLVHLDVVPLGDGWTKNPLGEVVDDRIYGRGVIDDKGPTVAVLHAMHRLKAEGVALNRRVRIIFGQCEEVGEWTDMAYYRQTQELPVFGFTPDADFPAIHGEKGILNFRLTMPLAESGFSAAQAGDATNVVPRICNVTVAESGEGFFAQGKSAHASLPHLGENAIAKCMGVLDTQFAQFFNTLIGTQYHGEAMGCGFADEQSGKLTLNAGVLSVQGADLVLDLDVRSPVSIQPEQVEEAICKSCAPWGISVERTAWEAGIYLDKQGKPLQAMVEAYRQVTGDVDSQSEVIGGGTYARAMPGIVAFGPMQPGRELTEHQADEYMLLEDLRQAEEVYRLALVRLANLEV